LIALAMFAALIGLGTWQVHRLAWKEALLARIAAAERSSGVPLPPDPAPFQKVRVAGRLRADLAAWYGAEVREIPDGPRMGAQLIEPLERERGAPVLVDLGWVPTPAPAQSSRSGEAGIEGYVHPAEHPRWFSARPDVAARRFYTLDPRAIGQALGLARVAPFMLVALGPTPPVRYPDPAHHLPRPPNNHLGYALTWFGLAGALVVVFVIRARRELLGR
jgi:surfeit locus 1 family protein